MQKYIRDFLKSRGLDKYDTVVCEMCEHDGKRTQAVDVHHITPSFRGKRKHNSDGSDLIALCRKHHIRIHSHHTQENRDKLLDIVLNKVNVKD